VLDYSEALRIWLSIVRVTEAEFVDVRSAAGRVTAEDAPSDIDFPSFDTSAMDGWAIRLEDLPKPGTELGISARIAAAPGRPDPLPAGRTAKVMTGAPIPDGTEAIVPVEKAKEMGGRVRFDGIAGPGEHVRRKGEIFRKGEVLVPASTRLGPREVALLASGSNGRLSVRRRPAVGILVTGDELVPAGSTLGEGQIRNSNAPFLAASLERDGARILFEGESKDEIGILRSSIERALASESPLDLLVTSGGVSMGDYDLVGEVLAKLGATIHFHRVNIKPAKPVLAASLGRTMILALPGNPVSVAVSYELFARPALHAMKGRRPLQPVLARLDSAARNRGPRQSFADAELRHEAGGLFVRTLRSRGSHDLLSHARANALAVLPPESDLAAGSAIGVVPLSPEFCR